MPLPERYRPIVGTAVLGAGAIGVPGAFSTGLDVGAMGTLWSSMIFAIAKESGHPLDMALCTKLAMSVTTGAGTYLSGSKVATWVFHLIPGAGTGAAIALNSFGNAFYTYTLGCAFVKLFDEDGFDLKSTAEFASRALSLMACFPTLSTVSDMIDLIRTGGGWVDFV